MHSLSSMIGPNGAMAAAAAAIARGERTVERRRLFLSKMILVISWSAIYRGRIGEEGREPGEGTGNKPIVTRCFRTVAYSRELLQHPVKFTVPLANSLPLKSDEREREWEREREGENCHFIAATYRAGSPQNRFNDLVGLETCTRDRI